MIMGLDRGVVMLLKLEGPRLPKLFWSLFICKSGGAQPYFYYTRSQKLEGPRPSRPIVRLRPCKNPHPVKVQNSALGDCWQGA